MISQVFVARLVIMQIGNNGEKFANLLVPCVGCRGIEAICYDG